MINEQRLIDLLNDMAELVDTCENYLALAENKYMTQIMKTDALKTGLSEIRDKVKTLYLDNGGEDVWE